MRQIGKLSFILTIIFAGVNASAQTAGAPPAGAAKQVAARLDGLDDFVASRMKEWNVPGLAIAIVKDGEVIYLKGYGLRNVRENLPVTPETLFAIGSITKSFTSLAFNILADDGKVDLDKPVRTYLPEFKLFDQVATERAVPRDLLSHRTGLPRHDLIWYSSNFSRADLVDRLAYAEPNKDFRSTWQYNNLTIATIGYLEGKVSGLGWEGLVKQRILDPLGMTHTNFSDTDTLKTADFAKPYETRKETVVEVPFHLIDPIGPAGSINSSVQDMSRYLTFQLGKGKVGEKQIVSEARLLDMHAPQMVIGALEKYAELGAASYGQCWVVTAYRGHKLVWHNGGIDGFYALLSLLPNDNMGLVVLTNLGGSPLPELIEYDVYDHLLGMDPVDWTRRMRESRDEGKRAEADEAKKGDVNRKKGTHPSHDLKDYVGTYENRAYGKIKVEAKSDSFTLTLNSLSIPVEHYHYDMFFVPDDSDSPFAGTKFSFHVSTTGDIGSISAPLERSLDHDIVFTRPPAEPKSKE